MGWQLELLQADNTGVGDTNFTTLPNNGQTGGPLLPVGVVRADDVAVFGCNSRDLSEQYSNTTFTGTSPTTNTRAQDAGAAAYTDTMVRGGTVIQASNAAQGAMVKTTNQVNRVPANQNNQYARPQVCTTEDGKTTCH
jgi:hypothetical protein